MKKLLILMFIFFTIKPVENEVWSLKRELKNHILNYFKEPKLLSSHINSPEEFKELGSFIENNYKKEQDPEEFLRSLKFNFFSFMEISITSIRKSNEHWFFDRYFGIEDDRIQLLKQQKKVNDYQNKAAPISYFPGIFDTVEYKAETARQEELEDICRKKFIQALHQSTKEDKDLIKRKSLEEVLEALVVILK